MIAYSVDTPRLILISSFLKSGYDDLSQVDSRKDGQLIFYDQLIPGSVLLRYLNADQWAVAVPINRNHPGIVSSSIKMRSRGRSLQRPLSGSSKRIWTADRFCGHYTWAEGSP